MELFVTRDISRVFPLHEGWRIAPVSPAPSAGYWYRVSRFRWVGEDVAFVAVSFGRRPEQGTIDLLESLGGSDRPRAKKALLVPQAADTSRVPQGIRIISMQSFRCQDDSLVWLTKKKNARKFPAGAAAAA